MEARTLCDSAIEALNLELGRQANSPRTTAFEDLRGAVAGIRIESLTAAAIAPLVISDEVFTPASGLAPAVPWNQTDEELAGR